MTFGRLRRHWHRISWLSQVMLVLSLLASVAATVMLALVLYLFVGGYAVGGNGIVIPTWSIVLFYAAVPCVLLSGLLWASYLLSRRRRSGSAGHAGRVH